MILRFIPKIIVPLVLCILVAVLFPVVGHDCPQYQVDDTAAKGGEYGGQQIDDPHQCRVKTEKIGYSAADTGDFLVGRTSQFVAHCYGVMWCYIGLTQ